MKKRLTMFSLLCLTGCPIGRGMPSSDIYFSYNSLMYPTEQIIISGTQRIKNTPFQLTFTNELNGQEQSEILTLDSKLQTSLVIASESLPGWSPNEAGIQKFSLKVHNKNECYTIQFRVIEDKTVTLPPRDKALFLYNLDISERLLDDVYRNYLLEIAQNWKGTNVTVQTRPIDMDEISRFKIPQRDFKMLSYEVQGSFPQYLITSDRSYSQTDTIASPSAIIAYLTGEKPYQLLQLRIKTQ